MKENRESNILFHWDALAQECLTIVLNLKKVPMLVNRQAELHINYIRYRPVLKIWTTISFWTVISFLILTTPVVHAQEASQLGGAEGMQSPSSLDCSDPLMATSTECSGENQPESVVSPSAQRLTLPSAQYGGGTLPLNGNYSDIEGLTRQAANAGRIRQRPLPREPLTEFQKFVASTTGQVLPIYGTNLFRNVPSTFAPLNLAPVPLDYILGPGDELRIRVWGQVNFQANVRVDRSGDIFLPQVGPVHVSGLPVSELDGRLHDAISHNYHNFNVTADVGQTRAIQVYVTGAATRPGVYTVSSLSSLVDALFASGGPSAQGSMRRIELRRGDKVITEFDLYDLLAHGDKSKDAKLLSGDVVYIPPVGPQVALTGSVRNPGIYEVQPQESLANLLADAGGVSPVAAGTRISIERIDGHSYRSAMEVANDQSGLATPLADGDVIRVLSIVPEYRKTVILRGNTANPGRFAWFPGMRITDLIPDKDSLITRNYWWRRAQLGLPAPEFEPMPSLANMRQPIGNYPVSVHATPLMNEDGSNKSAVQQPQGANQGNQSGYDQSGYDQSGYDQSGYDQNPNPGVQQGLGATSLAATQRTVGGTSLAATQPSQFGRNLPSEQRREERTRIQLLAPEIDWNYAAIERLNKETLKATVIPFDLGKLVLDHDASQNLELQPGDVVTIFSDTDIRVPLQQQTKLVRLEGEFVHAGVYTAEPGETLRHLVERAGGLTPNAYLYGSEFTRQSAREVQQARIDEYVQNLSMRMQRGALAFASSSTASPQDIASGTAAQSSERELLASLRQMRATGRIVLQFAPSASGIGSLPDLPLQNGDRFVVPPVPAIINVVGAVYDQNSFLYKTGLRAGVYLRQAGGPTKDADRRREFIIRANGEVVSRESLQGVWGDEFGNLRIDPGDTIVVPEKTYKPSAIRALVDWSQVFSQLALGAASINVIR